MSLPLTTSAAEVSSFDALRVVQIAEARIGGPMAASASLAATDARSLLGKGDFEHAATRARISLEYSIGRLDPTFRKLFPAQGRFEVYRHRLEPAVEKIKR